LDGLGRGAPARHCAVFSLARSKCRISGEIPHASWDWVPQIGLKIAFRLDGLAFLFALLILGIGLLVILYARYYLAEEHSLGRFYALHLLFMGSMLGIVLSDNLLVLFAFWELTSLSSFLLIGYWGHEQEARSGARMALTVTGAGGLALLAGFLLLGHISGTYEISRIPREAVQSHSLYLPALILVLLGAFTKSAQFPFHFWLPKAMAAPTPVSAYLHSATMVKAGAFLLARLFPVLSGSDAGFISWAQWESPPSFWAHTSRCSSMISRGCSRIQRSVIWV
jgi:multicomponent K+:H+ antiporter subunit A